MSVPAENLTAAAPALVAPAPATPTPPWYATLDDAEARGFMELKKYDTPTAAAKAQMNLEKLMGAPAERLLRLPEKPDAPEWQGIKEKLGFAAPSKAEDYGFPDMPGAHPEYSKLAAQWALEAGIPKDMALSLAAKQSAWVESTEKAYIDGIKAQEQLELTQLKSEWGERFAASEDLGRRAVNELGTVAGLTTDKMNAIEGAIGTAAFLKLFAAIGSKGHKEDAMIGADGNVQSGFGLSPDAAKARIGQLTQDKEWFGRYNKGDVRAMDEWNSLNAIAAGVNPNK